MDNNFKDPALFGYALKEKLLQKGITNAQLAEKSNITEEEIYKKLNGTHHASIPTLLEMCKALDVTPDDLLSAYLPDKSESEDIYDKILKSIDGLNPEDREIACRFLKLMGKMRK